jgi:hypothetical protein
MHGGRVQSADDHEFDAKWYGTFYQDVSMLGMDPLKHYHFCF